MADSASAPLDFFALFESDKTTDQPTQPTPPGPSGPPEKPAVFIPPPPNAAPPTFITPPGSVWINDHAADECAGAMATYYAGKGWTLIPIPWGEKGGKGMPVGWQHAEGNTVPAGHRGNMGLIHARSGTCAIDIDHLRLALDLCDHWGVDLKALLDAPDAVQIDSQRGNHGKLLYGLVFPLPSLKVYVGGKPVIDFRCATQARGGVLGAGVQDVLPPSMHPDTGKPYLWGGKGDWRCLPDLPGGLLDLWSRLRDLAGGGSELRMDAGFGVDGNGVSGAGAGGAGSGTGRRKPATGAQWSGSEGAGAEVIGAGAAGAVGVPGGSVRGDIWDQVNTLALQNLHAWVPVLYAGVARPYHDGYRVSSAALGRDLQEDLSILPIGIKDFGVESGKWATTLVIRDGHLAGLNIVNRTDAARWLCEQVGVNFLHLMFPPEVLAAAAAVAPPMAAVPWVNRPGDGSPEGDQMLVDADELKRDIDSVSPVSDPGWLAELISRVAMAEYQHMRNLAPGIHELQVSSILKQITRLSDSDIKTVRKTYVRAKKQLRWPAREPVSELSAPASTGQSATKQRLLATAIARLSGEAATDPRTLDEMATRYIWLPEQAAFYDRLTARWISASGFNGRYAHLRRELAGDDERQISPSDVLLGSALSVKPDIVDYWPGKAPVYLQAGVLALNAWVDDGLKGVPGDVSRWLEHLEWLLPNATERKHLLQWMAFCIKHQERKINHSILFGGLERTGKDALFQPLIRALGDSNVKSMSPSRLNEPYEDDFAFKKLTILNELHDSDMSHTKLENKLKKFGAAPPNRITLRMFGEKHVTINNVVQMLAFTNHRDATVLRTSKERWACYWCAPTEAKEPQYYTQFYHWLDHGGAEAVIHYLTTQIDLSDFNNGGTAPETEWQHALSALGEHADPLVEAVKYHIENRSPGWEKDIIKIRDVVSSLQNEFSMLDKDLRVNAKTVARALTVAGCLYSGTRYRKKSETNNVEKVLLWAVRNTNQWVEKKGEAWWAAYVAEMPKKSSE